MRIPTGVELRRCGARARTRAGRLTSGVTWASSTGGHALTVRKDVAGLARRQNELHVAPQGAFVLVELLGSARARLGALWTILLPFGRSSKGENVSPVRRPEDPPPRIERPPSLQREVERRPDAAVLRRGTAGIVTTPILTPAPSPWADSAAGRCSASAVRPGRLPAACRSPSGSS